MSKPVIVLDPGHGGRDPGAVGYGIQEKNVVLDLSLRTGKLLEGMGAIVKYTRTTDVYVALGDRARLANQWGADAFFSFHINAGSTGNVPGTGFESYILNTINGGRTAAIQNVVHRKIAAEFAKAGIRDRGQKKKNLQVLRDTAMSAVLLECGFINNPVDSALLKDTLFLDRLAVATAEGIREALGLKPLPQEAKGETYKLSPKDANVIIETWLGPAWNFSKSEEDKRELNRLANELRKASGQPTQ